MTKRKYSKAPKGKITIGGNIPQQGQQRPNVIVLTQPKRFGIDIADFTSAVRAAEDVDFSRRYKLYDLYSDILMDTHLSCVIEKRRNAVLCADIEFWRDGKPDEAVNEQIKSPWFSRLVTDIIDAKMWGFSLCQFYRQGEWVDYDLIPRKHADPVRRLILHTRPTSPAHHGTNTPTCFSSDRHQISDSSPRLYHGSYTSATPRATGHSSPRSLACPFRSTLTRPMTRTHDSEPSSMHTMPARSQFSCMARTPR